MSKRSNGEGSYYYNEKRKFWEYKYPYKVAGVRKYKKVIGKTKKEIQDKVKLLKDELNQLGSDDLTVNKWLDKWLDVYITGHVKINTEERYRMAVENHIKPFIGSESLGSLTSMKVQVWINNLHKSGGECGNSLSARTVNHARMILKSALKRAVGDGVISNNPVNYTKPIKVSNGKIYVLSISECKRLIQAAWDEANKSLWIAIVIALETGFRKGEVFGLKWSDIDFHTRKISINRTCVTNNHGIYIQEDTKTKYSRRTVVVTDIFMNKLKKYKEWQYKYLEATGNLDNYEEYIVTSEIGTIKDPNRYTSVDFKRILSRAGLDTSIRFHDLRHTHATQLLQAGVDIKSVSSRLGHSNIRITLDTYTHVLPSMQDNVINKLNELKILDVEK